MCLLVLCDTPSGMEPSGLSKLHARIDDARVSQRPIAFVHNQQGEGLSKLGIRIGRYEPIFSSEMNLPDGLIDFIVANSGRKVRLDGVAERNLFERVRSVLVRAGLSAELDRSALLS